MDIFDEYIERFTNWGRWGSGDQRGTANLISDGMVRDAARQVQRGQVIPLGMEFNQRGPQTGANGRFNCLLLDRGGNRPRAPKADVERGADAKGDGLCRRRCPFAPAIGDALGLLVPHLSSREDVQRLPG
jgi:hypothetical protein